MTLIEKLGRQSRPFFMGACLAFLTLIGLVDYLTGFEIFFSVFYLLAVGMGTWFVGRSFGLGLSVLSATAWIVGDLAAGARYSSSFIPIWNTVILLAFYFVVVWLLTHLRTLHHELDSRVRQRTAALTQEMTERVRLEKEILQVGERERQQIGRALHDGLGQHFTGTALATHVLGDKLAVKQLVEEEADARRLVSLIEEGIEKTRRLARGLLLTEVPQDALVAALQELAAETSGLSRVSCEVHPEADLQLVDSGVATHLYHIAQEAVRNALRHGHPQRIVITLQASDHECALLVRDDGVGMPSVSRRGDGLGLRIMAHRAEIIGWRLVVVAPPEGGTLVTCHCVSKTSHHAQSD